MSRPLTPAGWHDGDLDSDDAWDDDELLDDEESEPEPGDFWFDPDIDDR